MTFSPAVVVLIAGVIALILAALNITGARAAERQQIKSEIQISKESQALFNLPRSFVPIFFGIVSVIFSDALTSTQLGLALCAGMAVYFALQGWAYARSPEMRQVGPYIGTYLAFTAAGCYVIGAAVNNVI